MTAVAQGKVCGGDTCWPEQEISEPRVSASLPALSLCKDACLGPAPGEKTQGAGQASRGNRPLGFGGGTCLLSGTTDKGWLVRDSNKGALPKSPRKRMIHVLRPLVVTDIWVTLEGPCDFLTAAFSGHLRQLTPVPALQWQARCDGKGHRGSSPRMLETSRGLGKSWRLPEKVTWS